MSEPCACHPECQRACRVERHEKDDACLWPDCLSHGDMRALLIDLRDAGAL